VRRIDAIIVFVITITDITAAIAAPIKQPDFASGTQHRVSLLESQSARIMVAVLSANPQPTEMVI